MVRVFLGQDLVSGICDVLVPGVYVAFEVVRLFREVKNLIANVTGECELKRGWIGGFRFLAELPVRTVGATAVSADDDFVMAGIRALKIEGEANRCGGLLAARRRTIEK